MTDSYTCGTNRHSQLITTTSQQWLQLSTVTTSKVPRICTSLSARPFTVAGQRLWNNLPLHVRDSELTLPEFCQLLKTHLFSPFTADPVKALHFAILSNPPFWISDIRAAWRSGLSTRVPECQKLKWLVRLVWC